jgi:hypothetical protein
MKTKEVAKSTQSHRLQFSNISLDTRASKDSLKLSLGVSSLKLRRFLDTRLATKLNDTLDLTNACIELYDPYGVQEPPILRPKKMLSSMHPAQSSKSILLQKHFNISTRQISHTSFNYEKTYVYEVTPVTRSKSRARLDPITPPPKRSPSPYLSKWNENILKKYYRKPTSSKQSRKRSHRSFSTRALRSVSSQHKLRSPKRHENVSPYLD